MPGAGHIVHMPAHIYYRVGQYRESLETNKRAMAVDERYFASSPSDPLYRAAYYPHNIHFLMVSAQMGGDGKAAIAAAQKLDASLAPEVVAQFAILQPVKAAPYTTHAQFSPPDTILALPAPAPGLVLVETMYHYARAVGVRAEEGLCVGAEGNRRARARSRRTPTTSRSRNRASRRRRSCRPRDWWPAAGWPTPRVTSKVPRARTRTPSSSRTQLTYTEPPYWYYPVRQSLGAVRLRQGKLDEAEKAFRESLGARAQ